MSLHDTKAELLIFLYYFRRACGKMSTQITCLMRLVSVISSGILVLFGLQLIHVGYKVHWPVFGDINHGHSLINLGNEVNVLLIRNKHWSSLSLLKFLNASLRCPMTGIDCTWGSSRN